METAESRNIKLTGKIEVDKNFPRKAPTHNETSSIERIVSKLQEATDSPLDGNCCDVCKMLQVWYVDSVAARRKAERERQEMNEEERLRRDD